VKVQTIVSVGAIALLVVGCSQNRLDVDLYNSDTPEAAISEGRAVFVFPRESATEFRWHVPNQGASEGSAEYVWMVLWEVDEDRVGKDPDGMSSVVYWRPGGPRTGSLNSLLRTARTTVDTYCSDCPGDIPRSLPRLDTNVTVGSKNNRVVLTIVGRETIRRIFPMIPDSVRFYRDVLDGDGGLPVVEVKVRRF
jgi:hypothetical protein